MHKLDRSSVVEPTCLAEYSYPEKTWDNFTGVNYGKNRYNKI